MGQLLTAKTVSRVSATKFRDNFKRYAKRAKGSRVVLVENRREEPKYLVDREWLDSLLRERESALATLEILADRRLADRLLKLAKSLDGDVKAGRLHSMAEVFGA